MLAALFAAVVLLVQGGGSSARAFAGDLTPRLGAPGSDDLAVGAGERGATRTLGARSASAGVRLGHAPPPLLATLPTALDLAALPSQGRLPCCRQVASKPTCPLSSGRSSRGPPP